MSEFKIENLKVLGAAVFGDNAKQENVGQPEAVLHRLDLARLASDLAKLQVEIRAQRIELDRRGDVEAIEAAENAAKEGNCHAALGSLSKVGKWVFDVATKVGVPVAVAALKEALHIPLG
jgi:hypothetical protein